MAYGSQIAKRAGLEESLVRQVVRIDRKRTQRLTLFLEYLKDGNTFDRVFIAGAAEVEYKYASDSVRVSPEEVVIAAETNRRMHVYSPNGVQMDVDIFRPTHFSVDDYPDLTISLIRPSTIETAPASVSIKVAPEGKIYVIEAADKAYVDNLRDANFWLDVGTAIGLEVREKVVPSRSIRENAYFQASDEELGIEFTLHSGPPDSYRINAVFIKPIRGSELQRRLSNLPIGLFMNINGQHLDDVDSPLMDDEVLEWPDEINSFNLTARTRDNVVEYIGHMQEAARTR